MALMIFFGSNSKKTGVLAFKERWLSLRRLSLVLILMWNIVVHLSSQFEIETDPAMADQVVVGVSDVHRRLISCARELVGGVIFGEEGQLRRKLR